MNAAKLAVTTNSWYCWNKSNTMLQQIDHQLLMFYMLEQMHLYDWNGTLYISLIGAKVPQQQQQELLPQVRVLQVFKFLQQTELLYIILYQYLLQLEWEVHLQELLI